MSIYFLIFGSAKAIICKKDNFFYDSEKSSFRLQKSHDDQVISMNNTLNI